MYLNYLLGVKFLYLTLYIIQTISNKKCIYLISLCLYRYKSLLFLEASHGPRKAYKKS